MADKIIDKKLANQFGKDYVKVMVALLKGNKPYPKVASGALINSINYRLQDTANGINVILLANDYLQWVDKGREKGSYPPIQPLLKWVSIKGMPKGAAYAIQKNIYRFGIKPTNVIKKTIREFEVSPTFQKKYEEAIVNNIVKNIQLNYINTQTL